METNKKDFFEDFTILKWVKWTRRKPTHNGSLYVRWNGKYTSIVHVMNGVLTRINNEPTKYVFKNKKIVAKYNKEQKEILKNLYWLEETHDTIGYQKHQGL